MQPPGLNKNSVKQDFTKQIPISFQDCPGGSFYNTAGLDGETLSVENTRVQSLEYKLLNELFLANPNSDFTVYEVLEWLKQKGINCKESSCRRAVSNVSRLDKYKKDGFNQVVVTGKRINEAFSHLQNNTYGYVRR